MFYVFKDISFSNYRVDKIHLYHSYDSFTMIETLKLSNIGGKIFGKGTKPKISAV